jgi:hypothetical protein
MAPAAWPPAAPHAPFSTTTSRSPGRRPTLRSASSTSSSTWPHTYTHRGCHSAARARGCVWCSLRNNSSGKAACAQAGARATACSGQGSQSTPPRSAAAPHARAHQEQVAHQTSHTYYVAAELDHACPALRGGQAPRSRSCCGRGAPGLLPAAPLACSQPRPQHLLLQPQLLQPLLLPRESSLQLRCRRLQRPLQPTRCTRPVRRPACASPLTGAHTRARCAHCRERCPVSWAKACSHGGWMIAWRSNHDMCGCINARLVRTHTGRWTVTDSRDDKCTACCAVTNSQHQFCHVAPYGEQ